MHPSQVTYHRSSQHPDPGTTTEPEMSVLPELHRANAFCSHPAIHHQTVYPRNMDPAGLLEDDSSCRALAAMPIASLTLKPLSRPALSGTPRKAAARVPRNCSTAGRSSQHHGQLMTVLEQAATPAVATRQAHTLHPMQHILRAVPGLLGKVLHGSSSKVVRRSIALGAAGLLALRAIPSMMPLISRGDRKPPPAGGAARQVSLVWFRSDLRLHDHEALYRANEASSSVLPVYIFDPREYSKSPSGFDKTGPHRARFLLESVKELRQRLRDLGSDLIVRVGRPEEVLPALVHEVHAGSVYCHAEVAFEDAALEKRVKAALQKQGAEMKMHWGGTLYHVDDLPFRLKGMPGCYGDFRSKVQSVNIRQAFPAPQSLRGMPLGSNVEVGEVPTLQQLGFDAAALSPLQRPPLQQGLQLKGGEGEALRHMRMFIANLKNATAALTQQGNTNSSSNSHSSSSSNSGVFSCQVSPWLAAGCLSPRLMYQEVAAAAAQAAPAASAAAAAAATAKGQQQQQQSPGSWLVFELVWRDFFRFVTHKYTQMGLKSNGKAAKVPPGRHVASPSYPAMAAA